VDRGVAAGYGVVQLVLMLPMILETPKRDDGDARDLATRRHLRRAACRSR
jgi:hypothetical protein